MNSRFRCIPVALALAAMLALEPTHAMAKDSDPGTTIVGDQESAMGLYITPWKKESAGDMDRPPRLYDEAPVAIDASSFRTRSESFETLSAYRRAEMRRVR